MDRLPHEFDVSVPRFAMHGRALTQGEYDLVYADSRSGEIIRMEPGKYDVMTSCVLHVKVLTHDNCEAIMTQSGL
jgi:hypothetical protein